MIAPTMGATQKSHSSDTAWDGPKRAGPVLRAGFTEVLVTGIEIRWINVRARPIGMPAKPTAAPFDVVPTMMNTKKKVSRASVTKQAGRLYFPGLRLP